MGEARKYFEATESDTKKNIFIGDIPLSENKFLYVSEKIKDHDIPDRAIFCFGTDYDQYYAEFNKCRIFWYEEDNIILDRESIDYENYSLKEFCEILNK